MIKTKIFISKLTENRNKTTTLDLSINEYIENHNITREQLIDIKFVSEHDTFRAMLIYDDLNLKVPMK